MLKALFRKQFSEIVSQFIRGTRKGSPRKVAAPLLFAVLFAIIYVSLGASFFTVFQAVLQTLTPKTFPLYYLIVGLLATAVGLFGSVFNAYGTIFEAKDNEMLLSLPIPPSRILFVRIMALSAMTLLYEGAVLLPAFIVYAMQAELTALGVINALLLVIPLTLLVVSVTLALAFVVAAIARRVKQKKAVILIFSLLLVFLFYFLYFRAQTAVMNLAAAGSIPNGVKYGLFFYYCMGTASHGSALGMGIVFATALLFFGVAYLVMAKTFIRFTTAKKTPEAKGKKGVVKAGSRRLALYKRELRTFASSPAYIMNSALGVIFLFAIGIFVLVKTDTIRSYSENITALLPKSNGSMIGAFLVMITAGMNDITAPSVSMEGKRLYLIRSLPVSTMEIFGAKILLHLSVVLPAVIFAGISVTIALGAGVLDAIFLLLAATTHTLFIACVGLTLNVLHPVLDWKDEMTAVKTGMSVFTTVFGSIFVTLIFGGIYFPLAAFLSDWLYLLILTVIYLGLSALLLKWLSTVGKRKFEAL